MTQHKRTRTTGGDKRSSSLTFQRRLVLLRRLMRGPATPAELRAAAERALGPDAYPGDVQAAIRHDIGALRDELGCTIRRRDDEGYTLVEPAALTLIDLPDADLATLGFLAAIFSAGSLPHAEEVGALLARLADLLPEERRDLMQAAQHVRLEYPLATSMPAKAVLAKLRRALRRQMIAFAYRSSFVAADVVVRHRVAPYRLLHRDGHTYLEAVCHESDGELRHKHTLYRLDRIVPDTLQLLPERLHQSEPVRRRYQLCYILAPAVATQRDIALWFEESQVIFLEDGSAQVTAVTSDLWQARQFLMRYREHCQVVEPPELVSMICESIEQMAAVYARPDPRATRAPADRAERAG